MTEWQWSGMTWSLVGMRFYSLTVAKLFYSREKTKMYKTKKHYCSKPEKRQDVDYLQNQTLQRDRKKNKRSPVALISANSRHTHTWKRSDLRAWLDETKLFFLLKIQSMWKWYLISNRKSTMMSLCTFYAISHWCAEAQVHTATALKIQATVVHTEKWEHIQFQHMHLYQRDHDI